MSTTEPPEWLAETCRSDRLRHFGAVQALPPATANHSPGAASGARELCELLFLHLAGLWVEQVRSAGDGVVMQARSRAACPACGAWSSRVRSGYVRTVADGPAGARPVVIRLAVRRFLCRNPACEAVTFAAQVDGLTGRYLRRSLPLRGLLAQVGPALAGRAGGRLGAAAHRTTLVRLVAALPEPAIGAAPRIVGVDDFTLRRGQARARWRPAGDRGRFSQSSATADSAIVYPLIQAGHSPSGLCSLTRIPCTSQRT
jgi:hypothetical protein